MQVGFRERPGAELDIVQQEVKFAFDKLEVVKRLGVKAIGATETRIAHGMRSVPEGWRTYSPRAAGAVYQTRPPDERFLYLAAQTSFGSMTGAPAELFVRNDTYYCAGMNRAAGPADDNARTESNGGGAPTAAFDTHIIAYPEVIRLDCTITSLGFWTDAFPAGGLHTYAAICSNVDDGAGNDYPGRVLSLYEWISVGFLGQGFRNGAVSVAAVAGQKLWFITATNNAGGLRGYRQSTDFRPILGEATPNGLTGANQFGYIGIRSATAPAYDASITTFPAGGVLLRAGNDTIGAAAANTTLRPSVYFKMDVDSSASGVANGTALDVGIEVF